MKFTQFYVTRTQKYVNYDLLYLCKDNRNADRLNRGYSLLSYHMEKWNVVDEYSIAIFKINNTENKHKIY